MSMWMRYCCKKIHHHHHHHQHSLPAECTWPLQSTGGSAATAVAWRQQADGETNMLLVARGSELLNVHATTGRVVTRTHELDNVILAVATSPCGNSVATAGSDCALRVCPPKTRELVF